MMPAPCARRGLSFVLVVLGLLAGASPAAGVRRTRIGNNTEDIAFISSGLLAGRVAILDGEEMWIVPDASLSDCRVAARRLFGLDLLENEGPLFGMDFIASEGLFAYLDGFFVETLLLSDMRGRPVASRTIRYLGGFLPGSLDGLVYVPATATRFPDHLVLAAFDDSSFFTRLEVIDRSGQVVHEIFPADPVGPDFLTGVGFQAPDRLIVSPFREEVWVLDFDGNIIEGPLVIDGAGDVEGIVEVSDGRMVFADNGVGTLFFYDAALQPLPGEHRDYRIEPGWTRPSGLTWNPDTSELLMRNNAFTAVFDSEIVSMPLPADSICPQVDLSANGFGIIGDMTYLEAEGLTALTNRAFPSAIGLFDATGTKVEEIDVSAIGRPESITWVPETNEFVVTFSAARTVLQFLSRDGTPARTVDMAPLGAVSLGALAYFPDPDSGEGRLAQFDGTGLALVTDLDGNLVQQFDVGDLGFVAPSDVSYLSSGPLEGRFAAVLASTSEYILFELPDAATGAAARRSATPGRKTSARVVATPKRPYP